MADGYSPLAHQKIPKLIHLHPEDYIREVDICSDFNLGIMVRKSFTAHAPFHSDRYASTGCTAKV